METILILANFCHTKFNLAHFYTLVGSQEQGITSKVVQSKQRSSAISEGCGNSNRVWRYVTDCNM